MSFWEFLDKNAFGLSILAILGIVSASYCFCSYLGYKYAVYTAKDEVDDGE